MHEYKLIRSNRRTLALEISRDLTIIVRAPRWIKKSDIDSFVASREEWIDKHMELVRQRTEQYPTQLTDEEISALVDKAKQILPQKVEYYSKLMELYPNAVKITGAKTRFGSCSGKNSICFSYRLMMYPNEAIDYVVVHELAHIKHKNHGKEFYALIEKYLPDYKHREAMLTGRQQ